MPLLCLVTPRRRTSQLFAPRSRTIIVVQHDKPTCVLPQCSGLPACGFAGSGPRPHEVSCLSCEAASGRYAGGEQSELPLPGATLLAESTLAIVMPNTLPMNGYQAFLTAAGLPSSDWLSEEMLALRVSIPDGIGALAIVPEIPVGGRGDYHIHAFVGELLQPIEKVEGVNRVWLQHACRKMGQFKRNELDQACGQIGSLFLRSA